MWSGIKSSRSSLNCSPLQPTLTSILCSGMHCQKFSQCSPTLASSLIWKERGIIPQTCSHCRPVLASDCYFQFPVSYKKLGDIYGGLLTLRKKHCPIYKIYFFVKMTSVLRLSYSMIVLILSKKRDSLIGLIDRWYKKR